MDSQHDLILQVIAAFGTNVNAGIGAIASIDTVMTNIDLGEHDPNYTNDN